MNDFAERNFIMPLLSSNGHLTLCYNEMWLLLLRCELGLFERVQYVVKTDQLIPDKEL